MELVLQFQMGVSKNRGTPKWMVKIMENPIFNGWFGGKTPIFGNIQIFSTGETPFGSFWGPACGVVPWRRPQAPVARARPLPRNVRTTSVLLEWRDGRNPEKTSQYLEDPIFHRVLWGFYMFLIVFICFFTSQVVSRSFFHQTVWILVYVWSRYTVGQNPQQLRWWIRFSCFFWVGVSFELLAVCHLILAGFHVHSIVELLGKTSFWNPQNLGAPLIWGLGM